MVMLRLPMPPSNNHYKRHYCTRSTRYDVHKISARWTEATLQFRRDAGWEAKAAGVRMIEKTKEVKVHIQVYYTDMRKLDLDNVPKALFDALENIAWENDSQIAFYSVGRTRLEKGSGSYIEVTIEENVDEWTTEKKAGTGVHTVEGD